MDLICPGDCSTISPHPPSPHRETDPDDRVIAGNYQNPGTAAIWRVAYRNNGVFIRVNDNWELETVRVEPYVYRVVRPAMELRFIMDSVNWDQNGLAVLPVPVVGESNCWADLLFNWIFGTNLEVQIDRDGEL